MLATEFWEGFFQNGEAVGLVCAGLVLVLGTAVPTLIYSWYRIVKVRAEAELKQSMIERGMTPADIERVLQAKSPDK